MRLLAIAGLYVAGVIGAGFASGHELAIFFVRYGWGGLLGLAVSIIMFTLGVVVILEYCARRKITSYEELFQGLGFGDTFLIDWIYTFFLLTGISVMLAGSGALGSAFLTKFILQIGTALLVFLVLYGGAESAVTTGGWLAPAIVLILGIMSLKHLRLTSITIPSKGSWVGIESGVLYASYNLGFSMALLASVHHYLTTSKERWFVALLGNLILGISMFLICLSLQNLSPEQLGDPFPLVHLAAGWGPYMLAGYGIMLWAAMYTTALANALALVKRFTSKKTLSWNRASTLVIILSLVLSLFGFDVLVRIAYPILGLIGLFLLINLTRYCLLASRA